MFYDEHPKPRNGQPRDDGVFAPPLRPQDEQAKNTELYFSWEEWLENEVLEPNGGEDEVVALPLYLYDHSGITMNTSGFSCPWDSGQVGWIYCTKKRFREETGYTEDELFSTDQHREPKVREHVKVKGRDAGPCEWGQVTEIQDGMVTVDFDYCRPSVRKPENVVTVPLSEIEEVMANRAVEMLVGEVETYDDYLTGRVYGFVLEEKKRLWCHDVSLWSRQNRVTRTPTSSMNRRTSCWGFWGLGKQGIRHLDPAPTCLKFPVR